MTQALARARILTVDDDAGVLRAVSRVLSRDHEVVCFASAAEALQAARRVVPDLAILDIYMPETSGFDLMRQLRAEQPDVDVIIMTGDVAEPDANLVRAIDEGAFYFIQKPFDRRVLQTLVNRCLELRQLRRERQRRMRCLEQELEEARQFQLSFLPPAANSLNGIDVHARYIPCNHLAGDLYDYAVTAANEVALLIADVVGHGASAAMMTGIVKSAFHASGADRFEPLSVIRRIADSLGPFEEGRFVTLICVRIDCRRQTLVFANAGHPPAILRRRSGEVLLLEPTGVLICPALAGLSRSQSTLDWSPGDCLLLFTDGVNEARRDGQLFGRQRLLSIVRDSALAGNALLDRILTEVAEFTQSQSYEDDITLLTADFAQGG